MTGKLILIRHQESEWNKLGKWTGQTDVHLSEEGYKNGEQIGYLIRDLKIDKAYVSDLVRTVETLNCISKTCKLDDVPVERHSELNERDYGNYTGLNKWEFQKEYGAEKFEEVRRGWDCEIPGGENLKAVYERAVPFYMNTIVPELKTGKNILVVGHGNTFRALLKYIESINDQEICNTEFPFDKVQIFTVGNDGKKITKEIRDKTYETI